LLKIEKKLKNTLHNSGDVKKDPIFFLVHLIWRICIFCILSSHRPNNLQPICGTI
jgi:hypothetical protein